MLKKMLGIMLVGAMGASMLGGCAADNITPETTDENTTVEAPEGSTSAFESDEEREAALEMVRGALMDSDKLEWVLPDTQESYYISRIPGENGLVYYDCLVFSEDGEHNAYVAVDSEGNVCAMDIDRDIIVEYTPEFSNALAAAAAAAEDMTYTDDGAIEDDNAGIVVDEEGNVHEADEAGE